MAQFSVAVAQTSPVAGDVWANLEQHARLSELAAAEGALVVLFPELSLTGYELALAPSLAFTEDDQRLARLRDVASRRSLTIIAGAPVRLDGRLFIAALIFRPDGTQLLYTKQRLGAFGESARCDGIVPPAEATVFHGGDRNPLVPAGDRMAAVAICADIGQPSHARQASELGATAYLASMFVIPSEFDGDAERLCGYATRHSLVVALANFGGPTGGLAAAGRSSIWSADGDLLARLNPGGTGVAIAFEDARGWKAKTLTLARSRTSSSA